MLKNKKYKTQDTPVSFVGEPEVAYMPLRKTHSPLRIANKGVLFTKYKVQAISASSRTGISAKLFYDISETYKIPAVRLESIINITAKTIKAKIDSNIPLSPVHAEHLLKLADLFEKGIELFGTVEEFNMWLQKPFWFSTSETPNDWLVTPGGIDDLKSDLIRMAFGDVV